MTTSEGIPPTSAQKLTLHRRLSALAIEAGCRMDKDAFRALGVFPLSVMPNRVLRRFPPKLTDLTAFLCLRVTSYDRSDDPSTIGQLDFQRSAPPSDPRERGFRQNQWTVRYKLAGTATDDLQLGVELLARRRYAFPPDAPAPETLRERQAARLRDMFADRRTTRLRLPRDMGQPPLYAPEADELIVFTERLLDGARAQWDPQPPVQPDVL